MPSQDILHHGALADYCEAFAQSYECNALLVKLFSKWIQFDLLVSLLTADAEFRLGKRTTQMTVGEIKEESGLSHRAIQIFFAHAGVLSLNRNSFPAKRSSGAYGDPAAKARKSAHRLVDAGF
ncbi:MAG: hypothetical protein LRY49_08110 [Burkholderiaceae bacterium]|nr:hypothetical protein [Burkholderiaceae bacterium]